MRTKITTLLVTAAALYASEEMPSSFEDVSTASQDHSTISDNMSVAPKEEPSFIQIGGNYTYLKLTPTGFSSFTGNLGGVQFSYEYKPKNWIYEGVTFLWREGSTTDGSLKRHIFDADTQLRVGYTAAPSASKGSFTTFTGFGWRYISQKLTGSDSPLVMNYNEVYIPAGLLAKYQVVSCFSIGLNGIWMPQVFTTVNTIPLGNARWVTACTLGNFLLEAPLLYSFGCGCWHGLFEVRPFFEYWKDGKTLATTSEGIPLGLTSNNYYFGGVQLNIGINF